MKKDFQIIGILTLIWVSFFCTEKTAFVIQNMDEIMIQINQEKDKYIKEGSNALIDNNTVIPGISGKSIDVAESYNKMKKFGQYNSSLYVYNTTQPEISIENIYDKYIINGNKSKNEIALIFIIDKKDETQKVLSNVESSSFMMLEYDKNEIKKLKQNNTIVANYESIENIQKLNIEMELFCYNENKNNNFLSYCAKNKYHSFFTDKVIYKNLYTEIKKQLKPGIIIMIDVNESTLFELPTVLNYLKIKNYNVVSMEKLIQE